MSFPYIIQGSNLTVVIGNKPYTISKTHITYNKVVDSIKADDWDKVRDLIEPKQVVLNYGRGNVSVQGETLYWKGKEMHNALTTRMISMLQDEFPVEPLVNFMENLMTNPSKRAVDELYGFLEKNSLPITPDGHFLAYKKVRDNYYDCHTGTMDNSVGMIVEMERNEVDDNKDQTCSTGLHFCSQEYLPHFGGSDSRVVIVKINPRDVVSIPTDYNNAKGRACRYEVVGEIGIDGTEIDNAFNKPVQSNATNNIHKPVTPVSTSPKTGSTPFYRGYTDGYTNKDYNPDYPTLKDQSDYEQGYDKGQMHSDESTPERYRYVGTKTKVEAKFSDHAKTGSTPFYKGYDDGFNLKPYDFDFINVGSKTSNDYYEGYDKGKTDRYNAVLGRYRYVAKGVSTDIGVWPYPTKK